LSYVLGPGLLFLNTFFFICITLHVAGTSTDSVPPATADGDNGLPSAPLDEAFLATQTTSIETSQVFFKYVKNFVFSSCASRSDMKRRRLLFVFVRN
jgi:hypothetical protein